LVDATGAQSARRWEPGARDSTAFVQKSAARARDVAERRR
jgi:hypothetical protein